MVKGWGMKANIFNNVYDTNCISGELVHDRTWTWHETAKLTFDSWNFHWYFRSCFTSSKLKFHSLSNLSLDCLKLAWKSPGTTAFQEIAPGQFFKKTYQVPTVGDFLGECPSLIFLKSNMQHNESSTRCMFSIGQWHDFRCYLDSGGGVGFPAEICNIGISFGNNSLRWKCIGATKTRWWFQILFIFNTTWRIWMNLTI